LLPTGCQTTDVVKSCFPTAPWNGSDSFPAPPDFSQRTVRKNSQLNLHQPFVLFSRLSFPSPGPDFFIVCGPLLTSGSSAAKPILSFFAVGKVARFKIFSFLRLPISFEARPFCWRGRGRPGDATIQTLRKFGTGGCAY